MLLPVFGLHTPPLVNQAFGRAPYTKRKETSILSFFFPREARAHEKDCDCSNDLVCTYASPASSGCTTNVHVSVHARASKCGSAASRGDCFGKRDGAGDSARGRDILPS